MKDDSQLSHNSHRVNIHEKKNRLLKITAHNYQIYVVNHKFYWVTNQPTIDYRKLFCYIWLTNDLWILKEQLSYVLLYDILLTKIDLL